MFQGRKVMLVGPGCSGKTKSVNELLGRTHPEDIYTPTIGVDICMYVGTTTMYYIWDTAGDSRFGAHITGYYEGVDIIVVYGPEGEFTEDVSLFTKDNPNTRVYHTISYKDFKLANILP